MPKKGTTNLLKGEIRKALKNERLTPNQRREYIWMLAELDGFVFEFKKAKSPDELPTEDEIFAKNSVERIKAALGVKGESHGSASGEQGGSEEVLESVES